MADRYAPRAVLAGMLGTVVLSITATVALLYVAVHIARRISR